MRDDIKKKDKEEPDNNFLEDDIKTTNGSNKMAN